MSRRCSLCLRRGGKGSMGIQRAQVQSQDATVSALPLRLGRSLPFPASCFSYLRNGDKETVVRSARHGRLCRLLTSVFPAHHAKGRVASGE